MSESAAKRKGDEVPPPAKKRSLSAIETYDDFRSAFPTYTVDWKTPHTIPNDETLGNEVLFEIVSALALQLIRCDRAVLIDNETSKYPYIYEILKYLVRYCNAHYKLREFETVPADTDIVIEEFVRNSMDKIAEEHPIDTIMRWERHFKSLRGDLGSFGFVEFCVEYNLLVRYLVEVKQHLNMTNNSVTSCEGCYQACAELARAHQENLATAVGQCQHKVQIKRALLEKNLQQMRVQPVIRPSPDERKKNAEDVKAAEAATAVAHKELDEELKQDIATVTASIEDQPVFLALTDFSSWVFLKLQNKIITASDIFNPFPPNTHYFSGSPAFLSVLQYLAHGLSIKIPDLAAFQNRASLISKLDASLAQSVVLGVYSDAAKFVDNTLCIAPPEQVKAAFHKKYPGSGDLWDLVMVSRGNTKTDS